MYDIRNDEQQGHWSTPSHHTTHAQPSSLRAMPAFQNLRHVANLIAIELYNIHVVGSRALARWSGRFSQTGICSREDRMGCYLLRSGSHARSSSAPMCEASLPINIVELGAGIDRSRTPAVVIGAAKVQFLLPTATTRSSRSAALFDIRRALHYSNASNGETRRQSPGSYLADCSKPSLTSFESSILACS